MALKIDYTLRLPDGQFFPAARTKSGIAIHHTVGGTASSTVAHWLKDRTRSGKQMLSDLAECGVHRNEAAFFRVIQRLKQESLVEATLIAREEGEYPGPQAEYEITEGGREAVALMRGLCQRVDRRVRRLRWGGRRGLRFRPTAFVRCFASRHLPPRTVVSKTTDGSQVAETLTNVRSGRRGHATLCIVSDGH